jgi:ketosteroid isomerase-like protein
MPGSSPLPPTLSRLMASTNAHDIDGLVSCFSADYKLVMPNHPARDFTGTAQIRSNWTQIFRQVPDVTCSVTAVARGAEPQEWWTEWEIRGTRSDGGPHLMHGVMIMTVGPAATDLIQANRFYVEPTEPKTGLDNDAFLARLADGGVR